MNKCLVVIVLLNAISVSVVSQAIENPTVRAPPQSERFVKGLETLNKINGDGSGEKIVDALKDVSPDLAKYAIE